VRKLKESRRPEILDAAIAVVDEGGLSALTMRAVAERIGVTPMALYGYFRTKEDLLDGVVDRLLDECRLPEAGLPWEVRLRALAAELRRLARAHPTLVPLLLNRPVVSPAGLEVVDQVFRALLDAGVAPSKIARLERMVSTFVLGHAISEATGRFAVGTLDPAGRLTQEGAGALPAHRELAAYLEAPVDWEQEFQEDADDLIELIRRA
jgi:AcrR family transcriptional regulator